MRIATGEIEVPTPPNEGRAKGGKAGGKARAAKLSKESRSAIAKAAATARWAKPNKDE
jgi:hypothetical protein